MNESAPSARKRSYLPLILGFGGLITLFIGYTIYWWIVSKELTTGVLDWIQEQRELGIQIEYTDLKMSGYPYRFELDIHAPYMATPDNWSWKGEKLKLVMQTYNFQHIIGYAPGQHIIATPENDRYTLDTQGAQASFSWNSQSIKRVSLVANSLVATDSQGQKTTIEGGHFHMSPMPDNPADMRLKLGFDQIIAPELPQDIAWLGQEIGPFSAPIAITNGMLALDYDGAPDDFVSEYDPALISPLLQADWGPGKLKLKTDGLRLDGFNRPTGIINVRLEDIPALRDALEKAGKLDTQTQQALSLAQAALKEDDAYLPVALNDGKIRFMFQDIGDIQPLY